MVDKDGGKRTLSAQISQWEQPKLFSRHFQDSKYVGEKNTFYGGWWSDFSTKLFLFLIVSYMMRKMLNAVVCPIFYIPDETAWLHMSGEQYAVIEAVL